MAFKQVPCYLHGIAALMRPYATVVDAAMVYLLGIVVGKPREGALHFATFLSVAVYDFSLFHRFTPSASMTCDIFSPS
jgi:K+-sensing histidine kinase KdpD